MLIKSKNSFLFFAEKLSGNKYLGLDYGLNKTGVALYDSNCHITLPLTTINNIKNNIDILYRIILKRNIKGIVIGASMFYGKTLLLYSLKNTFVDLLDSRMLIPVIFHDESFTTQASNKILINMGMSRKKRSQYDDMVSAVLILQSFFRFI